MDDEHLDDRVAQLLADSQAARARGDIATAQAFANAALALRPGHTEAREVLAGLPVDDHGERRQLTVMFCDVVGSTPLSQQNDPEIIRSVLRGYRAVLDDAVTRVEGTIALWIGDGALVYFGHPVPHEDDAWRAVHAGVALLDGLGPVADKAKAEHGIDLAIRVAVHTGLVIRAEMGTPSAPDRDAIIGSTPNKAARLQDKARPGTMIISGETYALVSRRFEVVPVGPFELKGIEGVVGAFEVVREVPEAPAVARLADGSAFVGRDDELQQLVELWSEVEGGGTAAVAIQGDPGIGKSRLSAELRRRIEDGGGRALLTSCSTYHRSTPLFPARRVVESAAQIRPDGEPTETVEQLRAALTPLGLEPAVPVLADLLGVAEPAGLAPLHLDPQRQREVTLAALLDWLAAEARRAPLLLVVDDLQWADPTTSDLVDRIVSRRLPGLCLAMTVRAGHPVPWARSRVGLIELTPLAEPDVRVLVAELAGPGDDDLVASVLERADGVPLYVEELVNASRASGPLQHPELPSALRDPLLSRLAAAGDDLGLAQLVATIGDEVEADLLAAVTGSDAATVWSSLKALVAVGLLDVGETDGTFRFHHHLMAELAYQTQLHSARETRHGAVADAILSGTGPRAQASLGRHLELAGRVPEAIRAHVEAARAAQRRGSHAEAIAVLDHTVELLPVVVDIEQRASLEVLVLDCRSFTTTSVLGLGVPQAAADYHRLLELLRQGAGRAEDSERALISAYGYFSSHAELDIATELNLLFRDHLLASGRDPDEAAVGRCLLSFLRGDVRAARQEAEDFLASPPGRPDAPIPEDYPLANEPVASIMGTLVACQLLMLDVTGGETVHDSLRRRVAELPFPYGPHSSVSGQSMAGFGWWFTCDRDRALATFADIRKAAEEHGIIAHAVVSNVQDALAACRFGDPPNASHGAMMVEVWKATGVLMFGPIFDAAVAEGRRREGDHEGVLTTVEAGLGFAAETGIHIADPMLLCQRGLARVQLGHDGGEDDLRAAAALGAEHGSSLFELQARVALARIDPGARDDLATLVAALPPDLRSADVDEARALLAGS